MALRLLNRNSLLLNLGAGLFLCASIGCETPRGERGPNLNQPTRATRSGNQVQNQMNSPAYSNLAGQQAPVNSFPNSPLNSSGMLNRSGPNGQMQGLQTPHADQGLNSPASFNQQNAPMSDVVAPTELGQQGATFQQAQPAYRQPPLMPQQGPAMPLPTQGMPTSRNEDLKIPQQPTNAREAANLNGPSLMLPASHAVASPTLESVPNLQQHPGPKVLAEYHPGGKRTPESPVVVTPSAAEQPVVAPITVFPAK